MAEQKKEDSKDKNASASEAEKKGTDSKTDPAPSNIKIELDKANKPRTRLETLEFNRKRLDKQIEEERTALGVTDPVLDEDDDTKPLTMGDLKKIRRQDAQKTAIQLAGEIGDDDERNLVIHYLETKIIPSGNPTEDLKFARAAVNSLRSQQIAEEVARRSSGASRASGSGGPAKQDDDANFTPSDEELMMARFAKVPAEKQKDWIIAVRKKSQAAQK